jgi:hypothetical protein
MIDKDEMTKEKEEDSQLEEIMDSIMDRHDELFHNLAKGPEGEEKEKETKDVDS